MLPDAFSLVDDSPTAALRAYLLGEVDFEKALSFQRALAFQTAGARDSATLLLCEHSSLITVGRQGKPSQVHCGPDELRARRWRLRWVNRGGGCLLHQPGQLAVYAVIALDRHGLGLAAYVERLQRVLVAVLNDFSVPAGMRRGMEGVWVGKRLVASVGVAVCDWVAYYGAVLNVNPDLAPFRLVECGGPMTSLERERRGPLRPALVRERLLDQFATAFGYERTSLFFGHPLLGRPAPARPVPTGA
jgi:lipoyl(octanoyl) transferase